MLEMNEIQHSYSQTNSIPNQASSTNPHPFNYVLCPRGIVLPSPPAFQTKIDLTSLVDGGPSNNVRVDQAQVERSQVRVVIGNSDKQGAIDGWVTLIGLQVRLTSVATATALAGAIADASAVTVASAIAVYDAQRGVCHVKL